MVVFSYASLLPAGLYGFLWWAGQSTTATISFLELLCLYGYSLTIYIPVSLLWLIQVSTSTLFQGGGGLFWKFWGNIFLNLIIFFLEISWWQWLCVMLGAGLSGVVLFTPIWPAVRHQVRVIGKIFSVLQISKKFKPFRFYSLLIFFSSSGSSELGYHHGHHCLSPSLTGSWVYALLFPRPGKY